MPEWRKYWNPEMETMPRDELRELQRRRLRVQLMHVYENSPFYSQKFKKAGVDVSKIHTLEEFEKYVPITSKDELRAEIERTGNPAPQLCVPWERIWSTTIGAGTTGSSTYHPMTRGDHEITEPQWQRIWWQVGARPGMKIHYIVPTILAAVHRTALRKMGMVLLEEEAEINYIERILEHGMRIKPVCVFLPVAFYTVIEAELKKSGKLPREALSYQIYVSYGDVFNERMRKHCEETFGGKHYSVGGSAADIGAYGSECTEYSGIHFVCEDTIMVEVVDLKTGRGVESGGRGELVFTDIKREAAPHIRWRTEDLVDVNYEPCACGRTSIRVKFVGRTTFKVQVKGKEIFPIYVEDVIRQITETSNCEFTILRYAEDMDRLLLRLGYPLEKATDELKGKVEARVEGSLGVPTAVEFCKPEEIPRVQHKVKRVVDLAQQEE